MNDPLIHSLISLKITVLNNKINILISLSQIKASCFLRDRIMVTSETPKLRGNIIIWWSQPRWAAFLVSVCVVWSNECSKEAAPRKRIIKYSLRTQVLAVALGPTVWHTGTHQNEHVMMLFSFNTLPAAHCVWEHPTKRRDSLPPPLIQSSLWCFHSAWL